MKVNTVLNKLKTRDLNIWIAHNSLISTKNSSSPNAEAAWTSHQAASCIKTAFSSTLTIPARYLSIMNPNRSKKRAKTTKKFAKTAVRHPQNRSPLTMKGTIGSKSRCQLIKTEEGCCKSLKTEDRYIEL